jgi:hypothetical protein
MNASPQDPNDDRDRHVGGTGSGCFSGLLVALVLALLTGDSWLGVLAFPTTEIKTNESTTDLMSWKRPVPTLRPA